MTDYESWENSPEIEQAIEQKMSAAPTEPEPKVEEPAKEEEEKVEIETEVEKAEPEEKKAEEPTQPLADEEDIFKIDDNDVLGKVETKETEKVETPTPKVDPELERKAKEYESLESDPIAKLLIEARKNGEDIFSVLEKVKPVDVSKLTLDDLKKEHFKDAEETLKRAGLSQEEIDDELENEKSNFDSLSKLEQIKKLEQVKQTIASQAEQRLKQISESPFQKAERELADARRKNIEQATSEWTQMKTDLVGQKLHGLELTKERIALVDKFVQSPNHPPVFNSDGTINMQKTFMLYSTYALRNELLNVAKTKARGEGKDEVMKEVTRPSDYTTSPKGGNPANNGKPTKASAIAQDIASVFGGSGFE